MEFMDASEEFSGTNDHNSIIIKGKRTKRRQRPLSPVGRAMAVTSSSSSGGGGGESGASEGGGRDGEVLGYIYSLIPSSTTCTSDISADTSTDQEDEDMANCLILLAQGESCRKQVDEEDDIKMEKYSSRRFNEMVMTSATEGKVGFFVYECKTCNRSFPSFQALGGHRASHKKPRVTIEEKKATVLAPNCINDHHQEEEEEEEEKEEQGQINRLSPPLSVQSSNKLLPNSNNKKAKIHECGICGAEFSSGQALGGHMRRHRNHMTSTKVSMILEKTPTHDHDESSSHDVQKPRNIFPLDLNLPAPAEDDLDHRDLKFQFSANQQPHLVFSAPAMVDCHY